MMIHAWRRWAGVFRGKGQRGRIKHGRRLRLERLEDRTVPSVTMLNGAGNGYPGLDFNQSGGYVPPDTCGAAGPSNYVETVNQTLAIYSPKTTGASEVSDSFNHFFRTVGGLPRTDSGSGWSDPIVAYDDIIGRFIVGDQDVDFNTHVSKFDIAVSTTNDPTTLTTADWSFYSISTTESGYDADYPGNFGFNHDAFVFTLNMFGVTGNGHVLVTSISSSDLANAVPAAQLHVFRNDVSVFSLRPTAMHDSVAGDPMWLVAEHGDDRSIDVYKMTDVLSNSASFSPTNLLVTSYNQIVSPLNPNGGVITNNVDSRILKAAEANDTIVAVQAVSVSPFQDVAQWYKIDVSSGTPVLADQGQVGAGSRTYVYYPGIDINAAGDIGMSFMRSGTDTSTDYMSMWVTGRSPSDPAGTMEAPVLVPAGTGEANYRDFSNGGRAGDLSGINVDPVDGSFWAANEFANTEASANWGTAIANFGLSAPTLTATAGGPYLLSEGQALALDASASFDPDGDPLTYSWDINGDGVFGDATGVKPTLTWSQLQALGIDDGPATFNVSVQVNDGSGNTITSPATTLTLNNTAPTVGLSGPTDGYNGVQGQTRTFTLTATDPSGADTTAGFSYTVFWGDGLKTTTAAGQSGAGITLNHVYASAGKYSISATATDQDGAVSPTVTTPETILLAEQQGIALAVGGTHGNDTFVLTAGTQGSLQVTVNGVSAGTFTPPGPVVVSGYAGTNKLTVNGTTGNDLFRLGSGSVTVNGTTISGVSIGSWTINGQGGKDVLDGPDAVETWTISSAGGGKVGTMAFSGMTNLVGGLKTDTFKFTGTGSIPGTLDGGAGTNKLDYAGYSAGPITVNRASASASAIDGGAAGGFQHIQSLIGSSAADTLVGLDATTVWTISGVNAGKAGTFAFTGVENLVGGSGLDTFKVSSTSARVSSINGGGTPAQQGNWLDLSVFTATVPVTIDLNAGQASWAVNGSSVKVTLANIQNALGGAGNDTLIGNSLGNILIGGAGNDSITGGSGRSVLIGAAGSDTITDGSGSDVLISGNTTYDKNTTALMEILAEWQRTDENYSQRIADLKQGGGLNGTYKLIWGSTVKDDTTPDVLNGGVGGLDWFFANLAQDTLDNQNGNEQVN